MTGMPCPEVRASSLAAWSCVRRRPLGAGHAAAAERIVSLIPAVTEMIFAMGDGGRVVGVTSFDRFPPEVSRIARVGALLDPDVERILG